MKKNTFHIIIIELKEIIKETEKCQNGISMKTIKGKNCKIKIMLNINYNKSSSLNTLLTNKRKIETE